MARNYLDKTYLTDVYGLDLDNLPKAYTDLEINRIIHLAEIRITHIAENFTDATYTSMDVSDQDQVKFITCVIVEQWLKHGIPLSRISTSATLSAVSSSATRPQDPAYVPHVVLEGLTNLGLLENFDVAIQNTETKVGTYNGLNDNEINSRIQNMIENAISARFDGKENKVSPTGVQNGDSKPYVATWINGVRELKNLQDLFIAAGLSITPNKTIFGKKAITIDISTFLKMSDLDAVEKTLEAADKAIETEITSLKSTLEGEVKALQAQTTSLLGKTSGGFIGNLTAASAINLATPPTSDKDYYYYHITSDPETVLGNVINGQDGRWVKIEAKSDLSGWNVLTGTYLENSPFGLDEAGVDKKIADAEVRIGTIIDTKIKPVADWFEAQGDSIFKAVDALTQEAARLEKADQDILKDINAAVVRIKKNEDFKKLFDDLTDGTFIFKKDDTTYESKTKDQLATILADEGEMVDKDKVLITKKEAMEAVSLKENASNDWLVTTVTKSTAGGEYFLFEETPAIDALPYEAQVKIEWPATITPTFTDAAQVQSTLPGATGTERVILNVAGTNVMNYSELKNDLDKYMIAIKKKGTGATGAVDGNDYWQFVKFEAKPKKDLTDINVGTTNAGKALVVKADGTITYGQAGGVTDYSDLKGSELWDKLEIGKHYFIKTKTSTTADAISNEVVLIEVTTKGTADLVFNAITVTGKIATSTTFTKPAAGDTTELPEVIEKKEAAAASTVTITKSTGKVSDYFTYIEEAEANNRLVRFWQEIPGSKNWKPQYHIPGTNKDAQAQAISQTGKVMVVSLGGGAFFEISTNFGTNWSRKTPPAPGLMAGMAINWVWVSADGSVIYYVVGTSIGISKNSGSTWTTKSLSSSTIFSYQLSISSDGKHIALAVGNKVHYSHNFGDTWSNTDVGEATSYTSISDDGKYIAVFLSGSKKVKISTNSGASFTKEVTVPSSSGGIYVFGNGQYMRLHEKISTDFGNTFTTSPETSMIGASKNGQLQYAQKGTDILMSSDWGATYTKAFTIPGGGYAVNSFSVSDDGVKLTFKANDKVYVSNNYGITFYEKSFPRGISFVSISGNGEYVLETGSWTTQDINVLENKSDKHHQAIVTEYDKEDGKLYTSSAGKPVEIGNVQLGGAAHIEIEVPTGKVIPDGTSTGGNANPTPVA